MKIGSHVGMSGKEMLLGSDKKKQYRYGADTFMFYTGAPQKYEAERNRRIKYRSCMGIYERAWLRDEAGRIQRRSSVEILGCKDSGCPALVA